MNLDKDIEEGAYTPGSGNTLTLHKKNKKENNMESEKVILQKIGNNIKAQLIRNGSPSIEKLSKKMDLSFQTLLNLKNAKAYNGVSISTLTKIANVLNCTVIDLLS